MKFQYRLKAKGSELGFADYNPKISFNPSIILIISLSLAEVILSHIRFVDNVLI